MIEVKVCGLMRAADAAAATELGATYLGVIFAESPRRVSPEYAATVLDAGAGRVKRVGVFDAHSARDIACTVTRTRLDVVQLHGDPDARIVSDMRAALPPTVEIWAVVRVGGQPLDSTITALDAVADAVLLDARDADRLGGSGHSFAWGDAARHLPPRRGRLVVAGGLTAANVGAAIDALRPDVVDVSSGVESAPGVKDVERIRAFMQAAQRRVGRP